MSESLLPPRSAEVSDVMDAAMRVFRATLPPCMPLALGAILCMQLANMYWLSTGKPLDLFGPRDALFWTLTVAGFGGYQLLAALIMLRQGRVALQRSVGERGELQAAVMSWPRLVLATILSDVVALLGLLALVAPGLFALVCFLVLRPVVLFERLDPLPTLQRCVQLIRPRWPKTCAAAVIALLTLVVCTLAAVVAVGLLSGALSGLGASVAATTALGSAIMLGLMAIAEVYFNALWLALYSVASSSA